MYVIRNMHLTSLKYAVCHWANSKSDLQTFQQPARAARLFERQLCQMSLGQLNFDCPQFLVDLRRRQTWKILALACLGQ